MSQQDIIEAIRALTPLTSQNALVTPETYKLVNEKLCELIAKLSV